MCFHEGWMATVQKNQTINIYKLDDVLKMNQTGLIAQPWHVSFSSCQLNCASFIDANTLVASSPSNRSLSLWAGLNCLVKWGRHWCGVHQVVAEYNVPRFQCITRDAEKCEAHGIMWLRYEQEKNDLPSDMHGCNIHKSTLKAYYYSEVYWLVVFFTRWSESDWVLEK